MQTEIVRLELEMSKVCRDNERLMLEKGGAGLNKNVNSANLVLVLKKKIKELEGVVQGKDAELKRVKSDTRVTRMSELEIERNRFLEEARRLKVLRLCLLCVNLELEIERFNSGGERGG